jgi:hypothetical protein
MADERCAVCSAPVVSVNGACAFCRSAVEGAGDPEELLAYLAERLPASKVDRGFLGRSRVRGITMTGSTSRFRARWRRDELELEPDVELGKWTDLLLVEVSRMAAGDPEVRRRFTRAGWALR